MPQMHPLSASLQCFLYYSPDVPQVFEAFVYAGQTVFNEVTRWDWKSAYDLDFNVSMM